MGKSILRIHTKRLIFDEINTSNTSMTKIPSITNTPYTTKIDFEITLKPEFLKNMKARFDGKEVEFYTYPGVFSYRKPDAGSMLLARNLPDSKPGKILDIGCGCGILSLLAHERYPYAEIHGIDIDPRAIALSELNFQRSQQLSTWGSNLFDRIVDRDYDLLISNIPAKPTKEVHTELIDQSISHLKNGGSIYLVAAGRLSSYLRRLLDKTYGSSEKIARNKTHTVIASQKDLATKKPGTTKNVVTKTT
jgi:16S rRNA G1207 methylase RsmC